MEQPGQREQHEQRPRGYQKAEWANDGAHRPVWLEHSLCEGDCKKMRRELLRAHPKRTVPGRQKSLNILLQGEERVKPLEPCRKPGLAALHQRLGKARAGGVSIRRLGQNPGGDLGEGA